MLSDDSSCFPALAALGAGIQTVPLEHDILIQVLASAIFMYFTSVAPAITFAATLDHDTQGHVGAVEVLLSSAICGCIFSIFGGQPLVIVGVTGVR